MARANYCVLLHEGVWKVTLNETRHGTYITQRDAIRAAVDGAYKAGRRGDDAQVIIQDENEFRTEWTYGRDPYPAQVLQP